MSYSAKRLQAHMQQTAEKDSNEISPVPPNSEEKLEDNEGEVRAEDTSQDSASA